MSKKKEEKPESGTVTVNVQEFRQSRDSILSTLSVLRDAVGDLMNNYVKHTSNVLGETVPANLDSVLRNLNQAVGSAATRSASPDKNLPEKKKKRAHDPNAPKRPLTPFFLYMQTARDIIRMDLGPDAKKGAVSDEGTRRWGVMTVNDREQWARVYQDNLKLYQARMHAYKAGNVNAKNMTDDEAQTYFGDHLATAGNHAADAQLVSEALATDLDADIDPDEDMDASEINGSADPDADGEGDDDEEVVLPVEVKIPTPPPKTPKVKSSRKKATSKTEAPTAPAPPTPIVIASHAAEPEKKRKRKTKAEVEKERASAAAGLVDSIEKEELLVQTPAAPKSSKPKKKKTKNEA